MQSRTLSATINTQISLRSFGPLGVALLSIWALSPLGSQSCLRILSTDLAPTTVNRTFHYVDTMANEMFTDLGFDMVSINILNPIYVASILSPPAVKSSSMDPWGNVKIPYLSNVKDLNGDFQVLDPVPAYSSLLGIPLSSMESSNTTLSILLESTYINLDCSAPTNGPKASVVYINQSMIDDRSSFPNSTSNGTFWSVDFTDSPGLSAPWIVATDIFIPGSDDPGSFAHATNLEVNQSRLLFQSARSDLSASDEVESSDGFTVASCDLSQIYVESNVSCTTNDGAQKCTVIAQRPSQLSHASSNLTSLSFSDVFADFVSHWIQATGPVSHDGTSSFAQYYLQNTSTPFILGKFGGGDDAQQPASLVNVSAVDFGQRLGQLLNTYLFGSQVSSAVSGGQYLTGFDVGDDDPEYNPGRNATASLTHLNSVYVCSWAWLVVLVSASSIMLTAALLATYWELQTRIPDILGYCSSLTRDAPYVDLQGGNTLDGMERSRMLKDYRIMLGVVDGSTDDGVGHIAVAPGGVAKRPV